jgi:ABC-type sulfate/molybdate transport systems ATPase subunit
MGLKGIIEKVGVTSIIVTHDQEEAFDLADQVVIFNRWAVCHAHAPMVSVPSCRHSMASVVLTVNRTHIHYRTENGFARASFALPDAAQGQSALCSALVHSGVDRRLRGQSQG